MQTILIIYKKFTCFQVFICYLFGFFQEIDKKEDKEKVNSFFFIFCKKIRKFNEKFVLNVLLMKLLWRFYV